MEKEKMWVCPKAMECKAICEYRHAVNHTLPHKHGRECYGNGGCCPPCIPVEESPKPEVKVDTEKSLCPRCKQMVIGGGMSSHNCIEPEVDTESGKAVEDKMQCPEIKIKCHICQDKKYTIRRVGGSDMERVSCVCVHPSRETLVEFIADMMQEFTWAEELADDLLSKFNMTLK